PLARPASPRRAGPDRILRARRRPAAPQRRSRGGNGLRLARAGAPARGPGHFDLERAARLARRATGGSEAQTPRLADAARPSSRLTGRPGHLSPAAHERRRPVCRQGRIAPSSRQQLLPEAAWRTRADARDVVAGARDLV